MINFDFFKQSYSKVWQNYCQHEFVKQLAKGTLAPESFRHYLRQDYLFLIHFARAWGLAVYKSRNIYEIRQSLDSLKAIVDLEMGLHVDYCKKWDISEAELQDLPESRQTMAYTRYVLDAGNQGDLLDLHIALAPCLIGYAEIGQWIEQQEFTLRGQDNPYEDWIKMYTGAEFQAAARAERDWLNQELKQQSNTRIENLGRIFRDATRLEIDFWQMGLDA